jgi:cell wall-associated NlpC family hydrolase
MTKLSARLFFDLIGTPYVACGRGPAGYDCVGLAIELQRRMGRSVPDFISSEAELHRELAAGGFLYGCSRLEHAEAGCVALFRVGVNEHHLGTMIDAFRMLHTQAQTGGAVIETILGPLWGRRLLGYYALQGGGC